MVVSVGLCLMYDNPSQLPYYVLTIRTLMLSYLCMIMEHEMTDFRLKLCFAWKNNLVFLASGGERRDTKRRVDQHRELLVTVIWENRTTA